MSENNEMRCERCGKECAMAMEVGTYIHGVSQEKNV